MMFLNIQNESQELQTFLYYNQKDITECESTYDICDVLKIEYPENIIPKVCGGTPFKTASYG